MSEQKVIYKYGLNVGRTTILVPSDAEILKIGVQGDEIFFWAEHDLVSEGTMCGPRTFQVRGTGHPYERRDDERYLDTVMMGRFVWHVFEVSIP